MCWTSNDLKIKTAEEDISVWKIVYEADGVIEKCRSFYNKYIYTKNRYEYTPINITILDNGQVEGNKGFHSYSNKLKGIHTIGGIKVTMKWGPRMETAILVNYPNEPNIKMAKFLIPKGSQYIENNIGEIISTAIVFIGFIDDNSFFDYENY